MMASQLAELPTELLQHIATYLCSHCSEIDHKGSQSALRALSSSSSKLRDVAQPFCFHELNFFQGYWHMSSDKDAATFERMKFLAANPAIAEKVRKVTLLPQFIKTPERVDFVDEWAKKLLMIDAENPNWVEETQTGREMVRFCQFAIQIVIALLPNLEDVCISLVTESHIRHHGGSRSSFPWLQRRFKALGQQYNLPHLHTLRFTSSEEDEQFTLGSPAISLITSSSPSLRVLRFDGVENSDLQMKDFRAHKAVFRNIRSLFFSESEFADEETICDFVQMMPALQRLSVHTERQAPIRINDLLTGLASANNTLEYLSFEHKQSPHDETTKITKEALAKFSKLKTLRCGAPLYCEHWDEEYEEDGDETCLLNVLTDSIESLVIFVTEDSDFCNTAPDLHQLAGAIQKGRYPNLKLVQLEFSEPCSTPDLSSQITDANLDNLFCFDTRLQEACKALLKTRLRVWTRTVNTWFPYNWDVGGVRVA